MLLLTVFHSMFKGICRKKACRSSFAPRKEQCIELKGGFFHLSRLDNLRYLYLHLYLNWILHPQFGHILAFKQTAQQVNLDDTIFCICWKKTSACRGNTSNLGYHLKINHPAEFAGFDSSSSTPASGVEQPQASSNSWTSPRYRQEELSTNTTAICGECLLYHRTTSSTINDLRVKHTEKRKE